MRLIYIFDLDGTLANCEHRLNHIINNDKNWTAFFAACVDDVPIEPVLKIFDSLMRDERECWIWTGRSDDVRDQTLNWIKTHIDEGFNDKCLRMRRAGDHRPDYVIKREWLDELDPHTRSHIIATFEDRSSVVKMWRDAGVACFQVADGDF